MFVRFTSIAVYKYTSISISSAGSFIIYTSVMNIQMYKGAVKVVQLKRKMHFLAANANTMLSREVKAGETDRSMLD
jgi:hypothetical protein